jgi:hypothetical protein
MTSVFVAAIVCIAVIVIAAMAYSLLREQMSRSSVERYNSAVVQLEQDVYELSQTVDKLKSFDEAEILKLKERMGRIELKTSSTRHS